MISLLESLLHEALPYFLSLSLVYSLAYVYRLHLPLLPDSESLQRHGDCSPGGRLMQVRLLQAELPQRLTRCIRRKEAPDDGDSPCTCSFGTATLSNEEAVHVFTTSIRHRLAQAAPGRLITAAADAGRLRYTRYTS